MADSDAPPAKRQRTYSSITRSDIWHDDGSVVLQAESTQFRIHWSVLSLHSSFFRDMRGLPQPPDQPSIEGCPVIELSDTFIDIEHLLKVLYDPLIFSQESLPFPLIAAIVRMGRKYDFKNLLTAAVERLAYENPTTLEEADRLICVGQGGENSYSSTRIISYHGILFDTVTLARENNLFAILAAAYFRVVLFTIPVGDATLSFVDQRVCILAIRKIMEAQWKQKHPWDWLSSDDCAEGCTDALTCARMKKNFLRSGLMHGKLLVLMKMGPESRRFCAACDLHYVKLMAEARQELWDKLPSFFNLPPWTELKNDV
ncbi:hypothetical protein C8R44DRAFT_972818 [Mycena epipterygia]|nr:hypothetical protein C8R44DRAFT_972818 [Mycena epipterygia]